MYIRLILTDSSARIFMKWHKKSKETLFEMDFFKFFMSILPIIITVLENYKKSSCIIVRRKEMFSLSLLIYNNNDVQMLQFSSH